MIHAVVSVFRAVAHPYCANVREPVVPGPAKYIVSAVIAIVRALALRFTKLITVPNV